MHVVLQKTKSKPSEAGSIWKGGARERTQFSPQGGNGVKRTLRRREAMPVRPLGMELFRKPVETRGRKAKGANAAAASLKSKPSEAGSIWKGGAAKCVCIPTCGNAKDMELATTLRRRSPAAGDLCLR